MKRLMGSLTIAGLLLSGSVLAADQVKIGLMTTLSGPAGSIGAEMRDGFNLRVKENGGKLGGLPAEVIVVDDQLKPDVGAQNVDRLINREKVDLMTGVIFSAVLQPILPTILGQTFYLSSNTALEELAGEKCNENFFGVAFQGQDVPAGLGQFMTDKKIESVAIIAPNYPGGRDVVGGFKRLYKGKIVEEIWTTLGQSDYGAEITQVRASGAKATFIFLPGGMGINFVKQYNSSGLNRTIPLYTPGYSADEDTIKAVGEALVGVYNTSQWAWDLPNAANKRFVDGFMKEFGRRPTLYAAQAYDVALLVDQAVKDVGGKLEDKAAFRKAIRTAKFDSPRGPFKFNNNHMPIHDIYLRQVVKLPDGTITNQTVSKVIEQHVDPFAAKCPMKW
jgi:branched-chain amino acid transport system substrate-binding protein